MLKFENLWKNYPDEDPCDAKDEKGKVLFSNQCAIRLSHAMKKSGVSFDSFPQKRKCWVHPGQDHILAAAELADWIEKSNISNMLITENITGAKWREKVVSRTGIICFEDYYLRSDGSGGDHIDLWNGSAMTGFGSYLRTRFGIVIPSIWSDLGKSKKIRFFPVN
jgi:hypothetical protein